MNIVEHLMLPVLFDMSNTRGYITLMGVILATVVGASLIISMLLISTSSTKTTIAHEDGVEARYLADACIEAGLEQLRVDTNFTGSGSLAIGTGSCSYGVTDSGGVTFVQATGTVANAVHRTEVAIDDVIPYIVLDEWIEGASF